MELDIYLIGANEHLHACYTPFEILNAGNSKKSAGIR